MILNKKDYEMEYICYQTFYLCSLRWVISGFDMRISFGSQKVYLWYFVWNKSVQVALISKTPRFFLFKKKFTLVPAAPSKILNTLQNTKLVKPGVNEPLPTPTSKAVLNRYFEWGAWKQNIC